MPSHALAAIETSTSIGALTFSRDQKLIACGGWDDGPVSVWDVASGSLQAELRGVKREVHRLCFSPAGDRLAAVTVHGGVWVWRLADQELVGTRSLGDSRQKRSIVIPDTDPNRQLPILTSDPISGTLRRARSPDGRLTATLDGSIVVQTIGSNSELGRLDLARFGLDRGARDMSWSSDSQSLAIWGDGWAGLWMVAANELYAIPRPESPFIFGAEWFASARQLVCATHETKLTILDLPTEPMLTEWDSSWSDAVRATHKTEWIWGEDQWGYEGVRLEEGGLLWYSHRHNTLDGSALASFQTLDDFRSQGTFIAVPAEILSEVIAAADFRLRAG